MRSGAIPPTDAIPDSRPRGVGPRAFDPIRAHGAWIFLSASVAAGALVGSGCALERAMPAAAVVFDPSPLFLVPMTLAIGLATVAMVSGRSLGFLSRTTVVLGTAAMVTVAPVTAVAFDLIEIVCDPCQSVTK